MEVGLHTHLSERSVAQIGGDRELSLSHNLRRN
jgi:hypothetical protein